MEGEGRFIGVYSNYNFKPSFAKKSFSNEGISYRAQANKKDDLFWERNRAVPLTNVEFSHYIRRDSLQILRQTKPYLDSLDAITNKPHILNPFIGYSFTNSYKKWSIGYEGPLPRMNFNTVQGWNSKAAINFNKWFDQNRTNTLAANVLADYGISEDRLRFSGNITRVFNWVNKPILSFSGGSKVTLFNDSDRLSPFKNTIYSLLTERNYMKMYELNFGRIDYSQEIFNGLHIYGSVGFENRQPMFNTTDFVIIPNREVLASEPSFIFCSFCHFSIFSFLSNS